MATDLISRASVLELIRLRVLNAWGNDRDAAERHGLEALAEQIKAMPEHGEDPNGMVETRTITCPRCRKVNAYPAFSTSIAPRLFIKCGNCAAYINV